MTANLDPSESAWWASEAPAQSTAVGAGGEASSMAHDWTAPPMTPPPELGEKIAAAARAWAALAASDRYVAFRETAEGPIAVELEDEDGQLLQTLDLTGLFDLIDDEGSEELRGSD